MYFPTGRPGTYRAADYDSQGNLRRVSVFGHDFRPGCSGFFTPLGNNAEANGYRFHNPSGRFLEARYRRDGKWYTISATRSSSRRRTTGTATHFSLAFVGNAQAPIYPPAPQPGGRRLRHTRRPPRRSPRGVAGVAALATPLPARNRLAHHDQARRDQDGLAGLTPVNVFPADPSRHPQVGNQAGQRVSSGPTRLHDQVHDPARV